MPRPTRTWPRPKSWDTTRRSGQDRLKYDEDARRGGSGFASEAPVSTFCGFVGNKRGNGTLEGGATPLRGCFAK